LHPPSSSRTHQRRASQASWLAADPRRRLLRAKERLSLATIAEGLSAVEDRLRLVQEVAHRRHLGAPERRTARASTVPPWQGPEPQRGDRGFSVGEDLRGGRPRALFDPAKGVEGRKRHLLVDTEGLVLKVKVHSARVPDADGIAVCCWGPHGSGSRASRIYGSMPATRGGARGGPRRFWA